MSENFIVSPTPFSENVVDASAVIAQPDIVNSALDSLVVGLDGVKPEQLQAWLGMGGARRARTTTGNISNLSDAQMRDILAAAKLSAEAARKSFKRSEPYEFRLLPITGANPLGIPAGGVQFPLPPEKFDVVREQPSRTFVAINGIEYSLPGPQQLASITVEGMMPMWADGQTKPAFMPGYVTRRSYRKPKDLGNLLERLMKKGQPLELTIGPHAAATPLQTGGGLIGSLYVTIVGFQYGEAFGHVGDYVFSLQLKEWRPIFPRPVVSAAPATPTAVSDPAPAAPAGGGVGVVPDDTAPPLTNQSPVTQPDVNTYVVKAGDTLFDIAARLLGSGTRWTQIYSLNKKTIEDECKRRGSSSYPRGWHIWPGTKLKIPPKGQRDAT